jgi:hypothetical protein
VCKIFFRCETTQTRSTYRKGWPTLGGFLVVLSTFMKYMTPAIDKKYLRERSIKMRSEIFNNSRAREKKIKHVESSEISFDLIKSWT